MEKKNFWRAAEIVLILVALVIGSVSLAMNILRGNMEKEMLQNAQGNDVGTQTEPDVTVLNVLVAGSADYRTSQDNYAICFDDIRNLVSNYELSAYTQKSLIGTETPSSFGDAAVEAGFNMVGLAVPNALRNGKAGIESSMSYWDNAGVLSAGTYTSTDSSNHISMIEYGSITVAFLAFTEQLDALLDDAQRYLVNVYDEEKSPLIVETAREQADVVVVEMYWDLPENGIPNDHQKLIAKTLADAGASVIAGNSGTTIGSVNWIDDTLIFYGLGSMISDDTDLNHRLGMVGAVTITKTMFGSKTRVELTNPKADLLLSVDKGNGVYSPQLLSEITDEQAGNSANLYKEKSAIIQVLDDSIRIGGLQ